MGKTCNALCLDEHYDRQWHVHGVGGGSNLHDSTKIGLQKILACYSTHMRLQKYRE